MHLYFTRTYERAIRRLLSEDARREMEAAIVAAPDAAPVVRGTGGIRKLRWAGSGRGKRGGIRAIYFWRARPRSRLHADGLREGGSRRSDRSDLTAADRKALARLVAEIERERQRE